MNSSNFSLNYDILQLPNTAKSLLANDCSVVENLPANFISGLSDPIKFSASSVIRFDGKKTKILINLMEYTIDGKCAVLISQGDILQILEVDPYAKLDVVVLSERMVKRLKMYYSEGDAFAYSVDEHVFPLDEEMDKQCKSFLNVLSTLSSDQSNVHLFEAQAHTLSAFIFSYGMKMLVDKRATRLIAGTHERITEAFLSLVRDNFKTERFLYFYSSRLGITPKHLSRTISAHTGISAVDWITRYVIIEAKVLLRLTSMSINDISEHLNFPSQSFFGKYFKRYTGESPTEYRKKQSTEKQELL